MLLKFIYSIIILCCTSLLGLIFANTYIERVKLLNNLQLTLQMLETEIVYGATPLPILLEKIGKKIKREIGKIFLHAADLLKQKQGETFEEIWNKAVNQGIKDTSFNKGDMELLLSIGKNLGTSDSEDQIKHIRLIQEEIKRHYEDALIQKNKNVKLYKNLGFLLGLAIVIILY